MAKPWFHQASLYEGHDTSVAHMDQGRKKGLKRKCEQSISTRDKMAHETSYINTNLFDVLKRLLDSNFLPFPFYIVGKKKKQFREGTAPNSLAIV